MESEKQKKKRWKESNEKPPFRVVKPNIFHYSLYDTNYYYWYYYTEIRKE
jgi:hypothetical protein